jgi:hypothetical protein
LKTFLLPVFFIVLFCGSAQARVFDINGERFASYFNLSAGPSALKQAAFLNESNPAYTYDKAVNYNYTGEFGFLYANAKIGVRFGFEILKPQSLTEVNALNGAVSAYTFKSDYTGYAPKVGLEVALAKGSGLRSFLMAYVGSASISYKNEYSSHSEEAKGTATLYGGTVGLEGILSDTTTYVLEAGYRKLNFDKITYSGAVTTGVDGASHAAGDPVLDVNGQQRTLNFNGAYLSVGFRFYL